MDVRPCGYPGLFSFLVLLSFDDGCLRDFVSVFSFVFVFWGKEAFGLVDMQIYYCFCFTIF